MYLGYNWLIIQKTLPINASFVNSKKWLQVMFIKASFITYYPVKPCIKEFCTVIYLMSLTTGLISRYQS